MLATQASLLLSPRVFPFVHALLYQPSAQYPPRSLLFGSCTLFYTTRTISQSSFVLAPSPLIMAQPGSSAKSNKTAKTSKAAKAVLHPKSTLAAASASSKNSIEANSTSDPPPTTKPPSSSISKTPSNANIMSDTANPQPSAPSEKASTAISSATLPAAAQSTAPVLAPQSNDINVNPRDVATNPQSPQLLTSGPNLVPRPLVVASVEPTTSSAPIPANRATAPYVVDQAPATSDGVAQQSLASALLDPQAEALEPAASAPTMANTEANGKHGAAADDVAVISTSAKPNGAKDAEVLAAEVTAEVASSMSVPGHKPSPDVIAASTSVPLPVVDKAAQSDIKDELGTESMSAPMVSSSAAAVAQVAVYTPPELTRLQHNTFISRPGDPSRVAIRELDPAVLPAPLRPLDQQSGLARSPSHIVVFGWMDAPIRLVAKYAQPYTVLFPDATVLIQLSDGKSYLAPENVRREQLQRVIAEITSSPSGAEGRALLATDKTDVGDSTVTLIDHSDARSASSKDSNAEAVQVGGFVIHSFSDGGAGNLALFLDEMARRKGPSPRVHSLIMDSSPGKANPRTGSVAFTMHLSNRPRLRAIVQFFVYIGLYLLKIWTKVTGQPGRGELMRRRLNSLKTWSWVTASYTSKHQAASEEKREGGGDYPPRMYMYSKADKLIPWQFVEEHANELAKLRSVQPGLVQMEEEGERDRLLGAAKGDSNGASKTTYEVELRRWDRPPHCSIGRADFEGYWSAVIDFYMNVLKQS